MRTSHFIILIIFVCALPLSAGSNSFLNQCTDALVTKAPEYRKIIIRTPTTEIYDDGVNRTLFSGFDVYDRDNNLLLQVAPAVTMPVKLKMKHGTYIIKPHFKDLPAFQITVGDGQPVEYVIPREYPRS